jgi:hypothetical protein
MDGRVIGGRADLGRLPAGYYELLRGVGGYASNRVCLGVLEPLLAPTPQNSPVCIDVAMAWFFQKEKMGEVASLCQLAGINRVRDRLLWEPLEPKRGQFTTAPNQYDFSAQIQTAAGLQVLQVMHVSASWANPNVKRFAPDLRDIYRFYREMARRWKDDVAAFEPWNEADISEFGGHTGSEMASVQKAAYLGLKAGNPKVTACLNPFAIRRAATLEDFQANEAWPYYDTYNFHHYEQLDHYPSLYADHRAVSAGKPMWVSECSVHVKWAGDEKLRELSAEDLRLQSERVTKTYALAIYQGAAAVFYFMLPHYTEGALQYGVLRADLTPRPAFLAVAAVGRLLAGAKPAGRFELEGNAGQGYVFRAEPDGKPADAMVIWAKQETSVELPASPQACFDHLGRNHPISGKTLKVGREPLFLILAKGTRPALKPPPKPARLLAGTPGSLVLQGLMPAEDTVLDKSAYAIARGGEKTIPLFLYNFGAEKALGHLTITLPDGWSGKLPREVEVAPEERKELFLKLTSTNEDWSEAGIRIAGDFGAAGHPVLAMKLVPK